MYASVINRFSSFIRVCIDSIEQTCIQGQIYHVSLPSPLAFTDFSDFLLKVDAILDTLGKPRAFQRIRTFVKGPSPLPPILPEQPPMTSHTVQSAQGMASTFDLCVISRQNVTWQGWIHWMDKKDPQYFASALQMIFSCNQHLGIL